MRAQKQRHDPSKNLVGFVVGELEYAVPIDAVREIVNPLSIVSLPHAPHAVAGVSDYRGDVVPVVDLRTRFGLEPGAQTRKTKWIVLNFGERFVAIIVDGVTEVFGSQGAEVRPAPTLGGGEDVRGLAGVTKHGDSMVFLLDTLRFRELAEQVVVPLELATGRRTALFDTGRG